MCTWSSRFTLDELGRLEPAERVWSSEVPGRSQDSGHQMMDLQGKDSGKDGLGALVVTNDEMVGDKTPLYNHGIG